LKDKLSVAEIAARLKVGYLLMTAIILVLDQLSKYWAAVALRGGTELTVIKGLVNFNYTENAGIAFGMLNESNVTWLLVTVSVAAISVVLFYLMRTPDTNPLLLYSLSLLAGGISGNLIDRARMGRVIDFIEVYYKHYQWPVFNVADTAITIGAVLLAIDLFRSPRDLKSRTPKPEAAEAAGEN
jgi:signal peptidase II